nr:SE1561 family protein [Bacillus sp. ISL-35]
MLTVVKGARIVGSQINDKNTQVVFLKQRLDMFAELLEAIDPEETELEDIDRMIQIVEEMDAKCREFKNRDL